MEPLVLGVSLGAITLRTYRPTAVAVMAARPPLPGRAAEGDRRPPGELPPEPGWALAFTVGGPGRSAGEAAGPEAEAVGRIAAREDAALLEAVRRYSPALVAVGAPLSHPSGVCGYGTRACDLALAGLLLSRAARPPLLIRAGTSVAHRGAALRVRLERQDVRLVEVYPPATLALLGVESGGPGDPGAAGRLVDPGAFERAPETPAEAEAVVAAYQGWLYLTRRAEPVGHGAEGLVFIPAVGATRG